MELAADAYSPTAFDSTAYEGPDDVNESVNEDEDVTNNRRSKNLELNTQEDFYVISAKRVDSEKND